MKYKVNTYEFECEYCGVKATASIREDENKHYHVPDRWMAEEMARPIDNDMMRTCIAHVCPTCYERRKNDRLAEAANRPR